MLVEWEPYENSKELLVEKKFSHAACFADKLSSTDL